MSFCAGTLGPVSIGLLLTLPAAAQTSTETPPPAGSSLPAPATSTALADPTLQAREYFAEASKLYKDGDFDAALVAFEHAYASKPNYKVLYNIGQSYFQLRQYVEVRDAMNRYLSEGGEKVDAERKAAVEKNVADLKRRLAKLELIVNVVGATVLVDGKKVGVTPLREPIIVSEGERSISVEAPNRGVLQRQLRVGGGGAPTLTLTFADVPHTVVVGSAGSASDTSPRLGTGFWVTASAAVALGTGAGVTGYLAFQAQDDNRRQRKTFGVTSDQLSDSNHRATSLALTTDLLGGAAVICAGVVTVILLGSTGRAQGTQVGLLLSPHSAWLKGNF